MHIIIISGFWPNRIVLKRNLQCEEEELEVDISRLYKAEEDPGSRNGI